MVDKSIPGSEFAEENEQLRVLSEKIYGEGMRLMVVNPASLTLLKENARFFKRETFRQLRDNIASDKRLSSVPLCYQYEDGHLEVLSGNHRVQASIEAGIEKIVILVLTNAVTRSKRISIQLSHNALVGEDDQSILESLWAQIDSVADKLYSGLDSEMMKELGEVDLINFTTPQVPAHAVTFMFTDGEKDQLNEIMELLTDAAAKSSAVYVCQHSQYEELLETIKHLKDAEKIRDGSLAMLRMLEISAEYLEEQAHEEHIDVQTGETEPAFAAGGVQ